MRHAGIEPAPGIGNPVFALLIPSADRPLECRNIYALALFDLRFSAPSDNHADAAITYSIMAACISSIRSANSFLTVRNRTQPHIFFSATAEGCCLFRTIPLPWQFQQFFLGILLCILSVIVLLSVCNPVVLLSNIICNLFFFNIFLHFSTFFLQNRCRLCYGAVRRVRMRNQDLLNVADAAAYMGINRATLDRWRQEGIGPDNVRIGKRFFYHKRSLDQYKKTGEQRGQQ